MDVSQSNGASAPPAEEQVRRTEEAAAGGNLVEGDPSASGAVPGRWGHPGAADRGREVGDLGMAGLNIGAPMRLQRGGGALPPAGASTPLGGDSGELPRTYSGSSARADYRRRLELNTQDSDEDVLFRQEMNYPERGAGGFSGL
jgi:hypothetical protein